jgi:hypothetical protein
MEVLFAAVGGLENTKQNHGGMTIGKKCTTSTMCVEQIGSLQ